MACSNVNIHIKRYGRLIGTCTYCLHMWLELKSASAQSKMEELEAIVGALGFGRVLFLIETWPFSGSDVLRD